MDLRSRFRGKRPHPRAARRIPCEIWMGDTRHTGIIEHISSVGLFIHTRAKLSPGTVITVVFAPRTGRAEVRMDGRVVRSDRVRSHFAAQSALGIGVEMIAMRPTGCGLDAHDSTPDGSESTLD